LGSSPCPGTFRAPPAPCTRQEEGLPRGLASARCFRSSGPVRGAGGVLLAVRSSRRNWGISRRICTTRASATSTSRRSRLLPICPPRKSPLYAFLATHSGASTGVFSVRSGKRSIGGAGGTNSRQEHGCSFGQPMGGGFFRFQPHAAGVRRPEDTAKRRSGQDGLEGVGLSGISEHAAASAACWGAALRSPAQEWDSKGTGSFGPRRAKRSALPAWLPVRSASFPLFVEFAGVTLGVGLL